MPEEEQKKLELQQLLPFVMSAGLGAIIVAFAIKEDHPLASDTILALIGTAAAFSSIISMFKTRAMMLEAQSYLAQHKPPIARF